MQSARRSEIGGCKIDKALQSFESDSPTAVEVLRRKLKRIAIEGRAAGCREYVLEAADLESMCEDEFAH